MTNEQHQEILVELRAIRSALETKSRAVATAPSVSNTPMLTSLPEPEIWVDNAGEVTVHFGKNAGTPISALNDKQLLWYGADREPSLKKDGTPFPPREADTLLKNACRTLWHARVAGTAVAFAAASTPSGDETIPF